MATNFRVKISEIGLLTLIHLPGIPKCTGIYHSSNFRRFNDDDLASDYIMKNLVYFGLVTQECTKIVSVQLTSISSLAVFALQHHCYTQWRSVLNCVEWSVLSFVSPIP